MSPPSTSIIIPMHGHVGMSEHCVLSVLDSAGARGDVEIVVVDDATTPPATFSRRVETSVRLVRTDANLGFAGACNLGAEQASGSRLVFLNSDTATQGDWLSEMSAEFDRDERVAIVGARLAYQDGTTQHAGMCFSQADGMPRHLYRGFPIDHPAVTRTRYVQAVTGACLMMEQEVFRKVGGFDTGFVNGFEDVDLCLRLGVANLLVVSCGTTQITHLESVSLRGAASATLQEQHNAQRFLTKWGSIERDEVSHYIADGLLRVDSADVYPLRFNVDSALATLNSERRTHELSQLLNIRSRQVFDLEKEIGYLTARLLDHGIEP